MLSDPETVAILKQQVQECLVHVRSLNEKLASGNYPADSPELKAGVDALRSVLSTPSPKKKMPMSATAASPAASGPANELDSNQVKAAMYTYLSLSARHAISCTEQVNGVARSRTISRRKRKPNSTSCSVSSQNCLPHPSPISPRLFSAYTF